MSNTPVFSIEPLIDSFYIEQIGFREQTAEELKISNDSINTLSKSIKDPLRWVYIEYNGKQHPILLQKSKDSIIIKAGRQSYLSTKKVRTEKDT